MRTRCSRRVDMPGVPSVYVVTKTNAEDVARWINGLGGHGSFDAMSDGVLVSTPTEDLMAYPGDLVVVENKSFSVLSL
jgi:hypothetical protein